MNTAALRDLIDRALQHEFAHDSLASVLSSRIDSLHHAISLPACDAVGTLLRFVRAYIDEVPALLQAAAKVADDAGIDRHIGPVLQVAEEFFLCPQPELEKHAGLVALLNKAYLANRVVEEVNDRYITHFGLPLVPLDTTMANLVAYTLIGDSCANRLDAAVFKACEALEDERIFTCEQARDYRAKLADTPNLTTWQNWPCLSRRQGVEVQLSYR